MAILADNVIFIVFFNCSAIFWCFSFFACRNNYRNNNYGRESQGYNRERSQGGYQRRDNQGGGYNRDNRGGFQRRDGNRDNRGGGFRNNYASGGRNNGGFQRRPNPAKRPRPQKQANHYWLARSN